MKLTEHIQTGIEILGGSILFTYFLARVTELEQAQGMIPAISVATEYCQRFAQAGDSLSVSAEPVICIAQHAECQTLVTYITQLATACK